MNWGDGSCGLVFAVFFCGIIDEKQCYPLITVDSSLCSTYFLSILALDLYLSTLSRELIWSDSNSINHFLPNSTSQIKYQKIVNALALPALTVWEPLQLAVFLVRWKRADFFFHSQLCKIHCYLALFIVAINFFYPSTDLSTGFCENRMKFGCVNRIFTLSDCCWNYKWRHNSLPKAMLNYS